MEKIDNDMLYGFDDIADDLCVTLYLYNYIHKIAYAPDTEYIAYNCGNDVQHVWAGRDENAHHNIRFQTDIFKICNGFVDY